MAAMIAAAAAASSPPAAAAAAAAAAACTLGLDIGTTSVKVTLMRRRGDGSDAEPAQQVASISQDHQAYTSGQGYKTSERAEQDVAAVLRAIDQCMRRLLEACPDSEPWASVSAIGIACQMHGVVRWRSVSPLVDLWSAEASTVTQFCSTLITWEDRRCDAAFLAQLNHEAPAAATAPDPSVPVLSGSRLSSGFGLASLAWLHRGSPPEEDPAVTAFDHAGTIGDLVAYLLTASRVHAMDQTNAASWGWLDASTTPLRWSAERLAAARIPAALLPKLVPSASPLGSLDPLLATHWGLSAQTLVHAAVGDHPASIYAQSLGEGQMSISIGTSSQVCRVARGLFQPAAAAAVSTAASSTVDASFALARTPPAVEHRPYVFPLSHSSLLLCASLNGGNVLQSFVQGLERAVRELHDDGEEGAAVEDEAGVALRVNKIFAKLIRQGTAILQQQQQQTLQQPSTSSAAAATSSAPSFPPPSLPLCDARFFSERNCPTARGSLSALRYPLFDAAQASGGAAALFLALCRGVVANLKRMMLEGAESEQPSGESASASKQPQSVPTMLRVLHSIRCVGAALARNELLVHFVGAVFELPPERVVLSRSSKTDDRERQSQGDADAAQGAALLAMDWPRVIAPKWT